MDEAAFRRFEEKLYKVAEDVAVIKAKMENMPKNFFCEQHSKAIDAHSARIDATEKFIENLKGKFVVFGLLLPPVMSIIASLIVSFIIKK